jgi:hypothetical protein
VAEDVVRLAVVSNELEAEILCGLLRSNGILCAHRKSDVAAGMSGYAGGLSMAGPTEVLVRAADLAAAQELLETAAPDD